MAVVSINATVESQFADVLSWSSRRMYLVKTNNNKYVVTNNDLAYAVFHSLFCNVNRFDIQASIILKVKHI